MTSATPADAAPILHRNIVSNLFVNEGKALTLAGVDSKERNPWAIGTGLGDTIDNPPHIFPTPQYLAVAAWGA